VFGVLHAVIIGEIQICEVLIDIPRLGYTKMSVSKNPNTLWREKALPDMRHVGF